jgi:hypothetical protein
LIYVKEILSYEEIVEVLIGQSLSIYQYKESNYYANITSLKISFAIGRELVKKAINKDCNNYKIRLVKEIEDNPNIENKSKVIKERINNIFTEFLGTKPELIQNIYNKVSYKGGSYDDIHREIGFYMINLLIEGRIVSLGLKNTGEDKNEQVVLPTDQFNSHLSILNIKSALVPTSMPMVYLCKRWNFENNKTIEYGGYLWNNVKGKRDLWYRKSTYNSRDIIYDSPQGNPMINLVNGLSGVPYKINKDVLMFILKYNKDLHIFEDFRELALDKKFTLSAKYKKNKAKYDRARNDYITLILAVVYSFAEGIYFPVRADFRTRVYNEVYGLSYQGNELAKSLLLFKVHGKISRDNSFAINAYKAYGAGLYSSQLDKESFQNSVKWCDLNKASIQRFYSDLTFINNCDQDNKPLFIAWCFEYVKLLELFESGMGRDFHTYLPIQVDATCNGLQHLNMLIRNTSNMAVLNLSEKTLNDTPGDFYSFVIKSIEGHIDNFLSDQPTGQLGKYLRDSYIRIKDFNLTRKDIKKSIMVVSYNASADSMVGYIEKQLEENYDPSWFEMVEGGIVEVKDTNKVAEYFKSLNEEKKDKTRVKTKPIYERGFISDLSKILLKSDIQQYVKMYNHFFEKTTPALLE